MEHALPTVQEDMQRELRNKVEARAQKTNEAQAGEEISKMKKGKIKKKPKKGWYDRIEKEEDSLDSSTLRPSMFMYYETFKFLSLRTSSLLLCQG